METIRQICDLIDWMCEAGIDDDDQDAYMLELGYTDEEINHGVDEWLTREIQEGVGRI